MDTHALVMMRKNKASEAYEYSIVGSYASNEDACDAVAYYVGEPEDILSAIDLIDAVNVREKSKNIFIVDSDRKIRKVKEYPGRFWIYFWEDQTSEYKMFETSNKCGVPLQNMQNAALELSLLAVHKTNVLDLFPELTELLYLSRVCLLTKKDIPDLKKLANGIKKRCTGTVFGSVFRHESVMACANVAYSIVSFGVNYSKRFCIDSIMCSRFSICQKDNDCRIAKDVILKHVPLTMILMHNAGPPMP